MLLPVHAREKKDSIKRKWWIKSRVKLQKIAPMGMIIGASASSSGIQNGF